MAERRKPGRPRKTPEATTERTIVKPQTENKVKVRLKVNVHMPGGKIQKGSVVMLEQKYAMQLMSTGGAEFINE